MTIGILNSNCDDLVGRIVTVRSFKDGKYLISAPTEEGKEGFAGMCTPEQLLILLEKKD